MNTALKPILATAALAAAAALLAGCADDPSKSRIRLLDDFGNAVNQDLAAQIADPDAAAKLGPPPPSSGERAELAQKRYQKNDVIPPVQLGGAAPLSGGASGSSGSGGGAGVSTGGSAASAGP